MTFTPNYLPAEIARITTQDGERMTFANGQENFKHVRTGKQRLEDMNQRMKTHNANHTRSKMRIANDGLDRVLIEEITFRGHIANWFSKRKKSRTAA